MTGQVIHPEVAALDAILEAHTAARQAQDDMYRHAQTRAQLVKRELESPEGVSASKLAAALGVSRQRVYAMANEA